NVNGSITDGFGQPLASPDDIGWILPTGIALPNDVTVPTDIVLPGSPGGAASTVTSFTNRAGLVLEFDIALSFPEIKATAVIPIEVELRVPITLPAGFVLKGDIVRPDGTVLRAGTTFAVNTQIPTSSKIRPGNVLPVVVSISAMTWPAGTPLEVLNTSVI